MDRTKKYTPNSHQFLIAALFAIGIVHAATYWFYQPDDAFIYLVYVKNLIGGNGLTFNGERVEGFSSVSWTMLSALLAWLGLDPLQGAKALGVSSYLATAALLLVIQRHIAPSTTNAQKAALLLMLFSFPLLALWAPAAMEGILYALLITASCYAYFSASNTASLKDYCIAGLLFGSLILTRPEGAAFIGAIIIYESSRIILKKPTYWKGLALIFLIYSSVLIMLLLWRHTTYDQFFPTTVSAKTGNLEQQIKHGAGYVARFSFVYFYLVIPYLAASIFLLRRGGLEGWWTWLVLIFASGYTAFNILVGGDWMIGFRFLMPITPILISVLALALQSGKKNFFVVFVTCFVLYSFWLSNTLYKVAAAERMATEGDIIMGKHIANMKLPTHSKIAVVDAGAIPYFSGLPTIDMVGLNNKHISKVPGGFMSKWDNNYVLSEKPAVIQLHTYTDPNSKETIPSGDFKGTQLLFYTAEFQRWYTLDNTSIIPHLFIRRSNPIERNENFYGFQAYAGFDDEKSILTLQLEKTGAGIWPSKADGASAVSWQVSVTENNGNNLFQELIPLNKRFIKQGDHIELTAKLPKISKMNYRLLACPVLHDTIIFPQCNSGFSVELLSSLKQQSIYGEISFLDNRLRFSGWSTPEANHIWSLGSGASIIFTVDDIRKLKGQLTLNAEAYGAQQVNITLNQRPIFTGQMNENGESSITMHEVPYRSGENILEITTPNSDSPGIGDSRKLGVSFRSIGVY